MGYTLTWKSNFVGLDGEEMLVHANYLSQEDAERQADSYAEAPGAPAPQYILDPDDTPISVYRDVETFQVLGDYGEVVEEKPAAEEGDQGVLVLTQEKLEGAELDAAIAEVQAQLDAAAAAADPEPEPAPE